MQSFIQLSTIQFGFNKKMHCLFICAIVFCMQVRGQSPGGVSTSISSWFKANTTNAANLVLVGANVSDWKSEVNTYTTTQATAARRPILITAPDATANFNFNPSLQFNAATSKSLNNTSATPDLLGTTGTYFMIVNTNNYNANSSSCFTYQSNASYRYQMKAHFRIQTGSLGTGYTADFNPQFPTEYGDAAGRILVSRSNGNTFFSKRNGEKFTINNSEPLYNPAIGTGLCIGSNNNDGGTEYTNSAIAEIITYNTTLSDADINKVETYLAVKYGITLNQSATFGNNYTASNGAIIWTRATNANYASNITSIGRDNASGLLQKQSKSINVSSLISLYQGNTAGVFPTMNTANTSTFAADMSYLLVGDNGGATTLSSCSNGGKLPRMARTWKVQKTGTIGAVTLAINVADVPASVKNLLVSTDPTFPAASTTFYPLLTASGKLYVPVTLNTNEYFTFATDSLQISIATTAPTCTNPISGGAITTVSGGNTPYTFLWTPSAQATANLANVGAGTYTLSVTNIGGCKYSQSIVIDPVIIPANPTSNSVTICPGSTATFTVQNAATGVTYNWYAAATGGTLLAQGSSFTTPTLTAATNYYVEAVSAGGCVSTVRGISAASLYTQLATPIVTATNIGVNAITFVWQPIVGATGYQVAVNGGALQVPSSGANGLTHTVNGLPALTTASIQVYVLGTQTCEKSNAGTATAKTVTDEVYIPNSFTPNSDGRNDAFRIYSNVVTEMDMQVFNQWGQMIYETKDIAAGWNGTYKGKAQPVGVYMYAIKLKLVGGTEVLRKGDINLVR